MDEMNRRVALKLASAAGVVAVTGAAGSAMATDDKAEAQGQGQAKGDGPMSRVKFDFKYPAQVEYKDKYSLTLAGPPDDQRDPQVAALGLGTAVRHWFGDELPISGGSGEIPRGYITRPLFKHWLKGIHPANNGHFSYGPYARIEGVGGFQVLFFMAATSRGGSDEAAFTADVVDHDANTTLVATTFRVRDLPAGSDGFIVYSPNLSIPTNNRIETRIAAHGGASLFLYSIRWYIDTL